VVSEVARLDFKPLLEFRTIRPTNSSAKSGVSFVVEHQIH
jgi:hypothetical protein